MRLAKPLLYTLGFFSLTLTLAILIAPTCISSKTFREKALPWICKKTSLSIELENIELSWFSEQKIENLSIKSPDFSLKLQLLKLNAPLWKFLIPGSDLGLLECQEPSCFYTLTSLPLPSNNDENSFSHSFLSLLIHPIKVNLQKGFFRCKTPQTFVSLENIYCQSEFIGLEKPAGIKFETESVNGEQKGFIHFNVQIDEPKEWLKGICADIKVKNFPLELITPFVDSQTGTLLSSWSREPLNFNVQFKRQDEENNCLLQIHSAPLKTEIELTHKNNQIKLSKKTPFLLFLKKEEIEPFLTFETDPLIAKSDLELQGELESFESDVDNIQNSHWSFNGQTKPFLYTRRAHDGHVDAFDFKLNRKESGYSLSILSSKTKQLEASLKIGPTLDEKSLQEFHLTTQNLLADDIAPWFDLPTFDISWIFPLTATLQLEKKNETLAGFLDLKSSKFQSNSKLNLSETNLELTDSLSLLPTLVFENITLELPEIIVKELSIPRSFALEDIKSQFSVKSPSLSLEKRALKQVNVDSSLANNKLKLNLDSSIVKAKTELFISPSTIKLSQPLKLTAHIEPEVAKTWFNELEFIKPLDLELEVPTASWNQDKKLDDQWVEARVKIEAITLQNSPQTPPIGIPSTEMQLRSNLNGKSAHLMFYSLPSSDKSLLPASFKGTGQIKDQQLAKVEFEIIDLDSHWLDIVAKSKGNLSTLLSTPVNAKVNIELNGKKPLIHLKADTPHLKADFLWQQEEKWSLAQPAELHFQLPAKVCTKLLKGFFSFPSNFELTQTIDFVSRIDKLETLKKELLLNEIQAQGQIFLKKAGLRLIAENRRNELQDVKLTWKFDGPSSFIEQQLAGQVETSQQGFDNILKGKIASKSRHENIFNKNFELDLVPAKHTLDFKAEQLSSDWLDFFAALNGLSLPKMNEIIGGVFEIETHLNLDQKKGPVDFDFKSTYSYLDMKGNLVDKGLILKSPMEFQLQPHPGLSRFFTSQKNTSSISSISTQEPICIEISDKNFFLPLEPFEMKKMRFDQLHATIGEIEWKNSGVLHFFVNLLKWQNQNNSKTMTLKPLPIDLSMKEGILRLERADILVADLFPIAAWGIVDLIGQKLDLIVGVSKEALENALAISDLPKGYLMLVPVHGPLDNPAAESTLATAKIAALIARNSKNIVTQLAPISPTGALIGTILGAIVPIPDEKAAVPPPRYTIPWKFVKKEK